MFLALGFQDWTCVCVNSLGTPETRRRGRSTRKARRALTSNPPGLPPDWPPESASLVIISRTTLNNLERRREVTKMPMFSLCLLPQSCTSGMCTWRTFMSEHVGHRWHSPHYDDDKVQHVPAISDIGVLVHDQAVGNNLQKCLYSENDQEGIFNCFLWGGQKKTEGIHDPSERFVDFYQIMCMYYTQYKTWTYRIFPLVNRAVGMATDF